jgi:hypothetical protein
VLPDQFLIPVGEACCEQAIDGWFCLTAGLVNADLFLIALDCQLTRDVSVTSDLGGLCFNGFFFFF